MTDTKMTLTPEQKALCDEIYQDTSIDLEYALVNDREDFANVSELMDYAHERVGEIEIIYYSEAIKYLAENDNSLRDSLDIAKEYGYELDSLNSEVLATLHQQKEASEKIGEYEDRLDELFFAEVESED